jgi:protein-tyrosine phosphatase
MKLRRWAFPAVAVAIAAAAGPVADRLTRDPPNYSRIEPGLYLGGRVPEPPPGVTAVLNLCETPDPYRVDDHEWEPIRDAPPAPDIEWIRKWVGWITARREAGQTVFVHCQNGVSRSVLLTAAYLVARERWTRAEALNYLRERRPGVRPNPAFLERLDEWERELMNPPPSQRSTSKP